MDDEMMICVVPSSGQEPLSILVVLDQVKQLGYVALEPSDSIKGVARKQDDVIIQNNSC